jgi:hypothetical protein
VSRKGKMSAAQKQRRRERRLKRRQHRVGNRDADHATRSRQAKIDRGSEIFHAELMEPILAQSKPRQKALDKDAAKRRKRRERQRKRGTWA